MAVCEVDVGFIGANAGRSQAKKSTYIIKPEDGSQGDGIFMVQGLRDFEVKLSTKSNMAAVCQRYIAKPLLLGGFKFDLRIYVLFAGGCSGDPAAGEPPAVFICREGLARFCTERYVEPSQQNLHKCMGHLTNYSLNKRSDKFVHAGEDMGTVLDPGSGASKRPLTAVLQQLEGEYPGFSSEQFYESLAAMVGTSAALMAPALAVSHRGCAAGEEMRSFQVLGFDVMLDHRFVPYLLEINNSPSLCIDEVLPLEPGESVPAGVPAGRVPGRDRDKVCLCMEMSGPHRHQTSLVDLFVKKTAMCGAFRLLEQLSEGADDPADDAYIPVDVSEEGGAVLGLLGRAEALFHRCGGVGKALTSAAMRRHLSPLAGHGGLEKHDFDTLSRKFRDSSFMSHENDRRQQA